MPAPIAWTAYAHRVTLVSPADDGRHSLRVRLRSASEDDAAPLQDVLHESAGTGSQARMTARRCRLCRQETRGVQCSVTRLSSGWQRVFATSVNSRMHNDARKSWNFPEGVSTERWEYSAPRRKAKRRHFVLCELSRLLLELNATHIHIFESVYKRARNICVHLDRLMLYSYIP